MHDFEKSLPQNSKRGCPAGQHHRKSQTVKRTGQQVPARCVKSTTTQAESSAEFKRRNTQKMNARLEGYSNTALGLTKKCPKGEILRAPQVRKFSSSTRLSGYTVRRGNRTYRAYPKKNHTVVKAACIKDRGLPGSENVIGPLRKGDLSKYGYNIKKSEADRHAALKKAIEEYTALGVQRKLDAVAKLSKRTAPDASKIFTVDRNWVKAKYSLKAF